MVMIAKGWSLLVDRRSSKLRVVVVAFPEGEFYGLQGWRAKELSRLGCRQSGSKSDRGNLKATERFVVRGFCVCI